ncbi:hypothetical protein F4553_001367 [Allocatelliglobosispora scoriae]|uniref:DUF2809 domain-containing protein n=1 Tax=Allocatelliglobosispora scoriae TaxID=643052 RepID=A0A841BKU8_9ACTN|nr:DUF2809 domain-containing protein [Allocatelliglobosispora scoriae]MBB5867988.1 hypothetical protein [Allocatelliglobosispora scoriae]
MLRPRIRPAVAAVVVLLLGLAVRALTAGAFAKYAGVALYAALIYALVVCLAPRIRPLAAAPIALAICWLAEFAQLSPYPAELSARSTLARLVLGSTFNPPDLAWYAVGIITVAGLHLAWLRWPKRAPGEG